MSCWSFRGYEGQGICGPDGESLAQFRRAASSALECQGLPETTAGLETGMVTDALLQGADVLGALLTDTRQGRDGVVADVHFSDECGAILAYEPEDGTLWPSLDDLWQTAPQRWTGKLRDGVVHPVHGDSEPARPRADLPVARGEEPGVEDTSETFGSWEDPLQEPPAPRVE
ncbi:MAG: hypothetical protein FJY99_04610 [Candidatus Sericytochromatia bacterium]|nr:hypothetical protein [Candidatus Tanganyikabacteria bacterium]